MAQISVDSLLGREGATYPEQIAAPYRKELTDNGFTQMLTPEDVDKALQRNDGKIQMVEEWLVQAHCFHCLAK